jgi:hypothetical protein
MGFFIKKFGGNPDTTDREFFLSILKFCNSGGNFLCPKKTEIPNFSQFFLNFFLHFSNNLTTKKIKIYSISLFFIGRNSPKSGIENEKMK